MRAARRAAGLACLAVAVVLAAGAEQGAGMSERVVLAEDFDALADGPLPGTWWVEGGERVAVEGGRLVVESDPEDDRPGGVCTVWNQTALPGDLRVEVDAHVIESSIAANNINLFLLYSDPSGKPLRETAESRESGDYRLYHGLNGYIFTFLNDREGKGGRDQEGGTRARYRMRRCPGFRLLTETFAGTCRQGVTYHLTVAKQGGRITFAVDGKVHLEHDDPRPWTAGLLGLRTFRTDLWWDNLKVVALPPGKD